MLAEKFPRAIEPEGQTLPTLEPGVPLPPGPNELISFHAPEPTGGRPLAQPAEIGCVELTGATRDRADPISRFQSGAVPVFLISLKAGGRGLNLTAADTVIHYDPWWNPAVEHQATDRAHRIGQTKPVFVYKMIAADTVEERIIELQDKKGRLAAATLDAGAAVGSLAAEDLDYLFGD